MFNTKLMKLSLLVSLTPSLFYESLQRLSELTSTVFALLADLGEDVGDGGVHVVLGRVF